MRGATKGAEDVYTCTLFQSTRPMRGATEDIEQFIADTLVSIHAPHAGRDCGSPSPLDLHPRFNPRAPCGARQTPLTDMKSSGRFQSTRPMRGATIRKAYNLPIIDVSIHAPHAGRDVVLLKYDCIRQVSIHAPHAGRDLISTCPAASPASFNPRAPCGARPSACVIVVSLMVFQSTRPMRGATTVRTV